MGKRRKQEREPVPFQSIHIPSQAVGDAPASSATTTTTAAHSNSNNNTAASMAKTRATSSSPLRQRRRSRSPLNFIRRTFSRSRSPLGRAPKPNQTVAVVAVDQENNRPNGISERKTKRKAPLFRPQSTFRSSSERIAISSAAVNPSMSTNNGVSPSSAGCQTTGSISALTQPTLEDDDEETTLRTDHAVAVDSKDGTSENCQIIFRPKSHSNDNHDGGGHSHRVKVRVDDDERMTIIRHSEETEIVFESKSNKKTKVSTTTKAPSQQHSLQQQQDGAIHQSFSQGSESSPVNISPGGNLFERVWTAWNPSGQQQQQSPHSQSWLQETNNALVHVPSTTGHFLATRASNTHKPKVEGLRYTLTDPNASTEQSFVQESTMDTSATSIVLLETSGDQDDMSVLESFGAAERPPPLPTLSETNAQLSRLEKTANEEDSKQDISYLQHAVENEDRTDTKLSAKGTFDSAYSNATSYRGPILDFTEPPCKIFLLLLDPKTKIFELIQLIYAPSTTTLGEILDMIQYNATEPALAQQRYTGLIRPRSRASPWTDKRVLMNSKIGPGEILVAIPYEYATKYINRLGRQILKNPRIQSLLETSNDPLLKPPTSKQKHRSKSPTALEDRHDTSICSEVSSTRIRRSSPVTTVLEEETEEEDELVLENSLAPQSILSVADENRLAAAQLDIQKAVADSPDNCEDAAKVVTPSPSPGDSTMVTAHQYEESPDINVDLDVSISSSRRGAGDDISYGRACGPLIESRIQRLRENFRDSPRADEDFAHLTETPTKDGIAVFKDSPSVTTPNKQVTPQVLRDIGPDRRSTAAAILPQQRYLDRRPNKKNAHYDSRSTSAFESTPPAKQNGYSTDGDEVESKSNGINKIRRRFSTGTPDDSFSVDDETSISMSYTSWSQSTALALRFPKPAASPSASVSDDSLMEKRTSMEAALRRSASFSIKTSARRKKKIAMRQVSRFFGIAVAVMIILYALDVDNHQSKSAYLKNPLNDSPLGILGFLQFLLAFSVLVKFQMFLRQQPGQESKCPFMIGCSVHLENLRDKATRNNRRPRKAVV